MVVLFIQKNVMVYILSLSIKPYTEEYPNRIGFYESSI